MAEELKFYEGEEEKWCNEMSVAVLLPGKAAKLTAVEEKHT